MAELVDFRDNVTISVTVRARPARPAARAARARAQVALRGRDHCAGRKPDGGIQFGEHFVGPQVGPVSGVLKAREMGAWTPKQVADTVLIDRRAPRCPRSGGWSMR